MTDDYPDQALKNAIGEFLKAADELDIRPMIGNYVMFVEMTDPNTGEQGFVRLRTPEMPLWNEYGVMALRTEEIRYEWMQNRVAEQMFDAFGHDHDDDEGEF